MDWGAWAIFVMVVFIGSYIQAVAGFAMAMLIVAVVGGLRLMDIPTLAATISLLTILNVIMSLYGNLHHINHRLFGWLALGQVPAIAGGLALMHWLDGNVRWVLEVCLGVFITAGGLSMFLRPHPWATVTGPIRTWLVGVTGGMVGGLFSASGPVLGWFVYSQPLPVAEIRATLLACFMLTTLTRTIGVGVSGGLTTTVLSSAAVGLPVVVLGTWIGRNFVPVLSEQTIKRCAYLLLIAMGLWILSRAIWLRT